MLSCASLVSCWLNFMRSWTAMESRSPCCGHSQGMTLQIHSQIGGSANIATARVIIANIRSKAILQKWLRVQKLEERGAPRIIPEGGVHPARGGKPTRLSVPHTSRTEHRNTQSRHLQLAPAPPKHSGTRIQNGIDRGCAKDKAFCNIKHKIAASLARCQMSH
jgi:hypothetical protein